MPSSAPHPGSPYSLCLMSWTARQGQLEHMSENMRTTMINIPELNTGGVTTSSCWILVSRSRDATCSRRFCHGGQRDVRGHREVTSAAPHVAIQPS